MDIRAAVKRIIRSFFHRPKYSRKEFGAIGRHTVIGEECALVPQNMYLDDYVIVQNRVNFISSDGKLVVKKFSVVSSQCVIIPGTHRPVPGIPFYFQAKEHAGDEHHTIKIAEDCWIGAASVLLMKADIGRGAIVAASSVVTKEVPPYAVVAGNPARIIAVKFSKSDILCHEERLYPPSERYSAEEIDRLFAKHFQGISVLEKLDPDSLPVKFDILSYKLV